MSIVKGLLCIDRERSRYSKLMNKRVLETLFKNKVRKKYTNLKYSVLRIEGPLFNTTLVCGWELKQKLKIPETKKKNV